MQLRILIIIFSCFLISFSVIQNENAKKIEPQSRIFGGFSRVSFINNQHLFVGSASYIKIYQIESKDSLLLISSFHLNTVVEGISVKANILFALDEKYGLYIYNIDDIRNPKLISRLYLNHSSYDFKVDNDNIYVSHGKEGITQINISNLTDPRILNTSEVFSNKIDVFGNYLYTTSKFAEYEYEKTYSFIKILDKSNLQFIREDTVWGHSEHLEVLDFKIIENKGALLEQHSFFEGSYCILQFYDLDNPLYPVEAGNIHLSTTTASFALINSDTCFVTEGVNLNGVDFSNINEPKIVSKNPVLVDNSSLQHLHHNKSYLSVNYDHFSGFTLIDIKDLADPQKGIYISTESMIECVSATDSVLIAGSRLNNGLYLVNISDINNPEINYYYDYKIGSVNEVKIQNNLVYAATDSGLQILRIHGVDSLSLEGKLNYGKKTSLIEVSDSLVVIGGNYYDVHLIDVSNPAQPEYLNSIGITGYITDFILKDKNLFIGRANKPICAYDISNHNNPVLSWNSHYEASSFYIQDNTLLTAKHDMLSIIDISNFDNPSLVNTYKISSSLGDLYLRDSFLFISSLEIFYTYKTSDFSEFFLYGMSQLDKKGSAGNISSNSNYIFTAKGNAGIYVYDYNSIISALEAEINSTQSTFILKQNYPNPFNQSTTIIYQLPKTSNVTLSIYNILGQRIETVIDQVQNSGTHKIQWNSKGFSSGIYFYKLETNHGFVQLKKIVLVK